jgi:hypothetical protein
MFGYGSLGLGLYLGLLSIGKLLLELFDALHVRTRGINLGDDGIREVFLH